jgi:hypothetical protein
MGKSIGAGMRHLSKSSAVFNILIGKLLTLRFYKMRLVQW